MEDGKVMINVLYEDNHLLVVEKPINILVQKDNTGDKDLLTILKNYIKEKYNKPGNVYLGLVHRLDRDTAGLMIVAKSPLYAAQWTKMIGGKLVQKEYTAICVGKLKNHKGIIRTAVIQHGNEKPATTHYNIIEEKIIKTEEDEFTITKYNLRLETGRMHQIRIHLAKENCPIIADDKHGNFKINKKVRKLGYKQLMLAATKLTIPINGKNCIFEIPLPEHMNIF